MINNTDDIALYIIKTGGDCTGVENCPYCPCWTGGKVGSYQPSIKYLKKYCSVFDRMEEKNVSYPAKREIALRYLTDKYGKDKVKELILESIV